ncbi:MAG: hypothetical protein JJ895_04665 [Balneolaceae bacterium]|nr:hypothetical protein [Balneolaceae bacterium]
MRLRIFLSAVTIFTYSCVNATTEVGKTHKIIPDKTPFISGFLDVSNDTTHYHPQVVVGYVSDARFVENYKELKNLTSLYSPTHLAQVVFTSRLFQLQFYTDSTALVEVSGPLDSQFSKTIQYQRESNSVYGDVNSQLKILPGHRYKLNVTLVDGRKFESITYIPEEVDIFIPDSIGLKVQLKHYEDGTPREESESHFWTKFEFPENTFISETQKNSSIDRELLFMEPWESFRFSDRSSFLRTGLSYGAWLSESDIDSVQTGWWINLTEPWFRKDLIVNQWRRFSFYSNGLWRNHQALNNRIAPFGNWEDIYLEYGEAANQKDSTYLKRVSTIDEISPDGEILPKDEANVIGFFAGSFSVYKKTVVYPIRNFDLDSVLTAHGLNDD